MYGEQLANESHEMFKVTLLHGDQAPYNKGWTLGVFQKKKIWPQRTKVFIEDHFIKCVSTENIFTG